MKLIFKWAEFYGYVFCPYFCNSNVFMFQSEPNFTILNSIALVIGTLFLVIRFSFN